MPDDDRASPPGHKEKCNSHQVRKHAIGLQDRSAATGSGMGLGSRDGEACSEQMAAYKKATLVGPGKRVPRKGCKGRATIVGGPPRGARHWRHGRYVPVAPVAGSTEGPHLVDRGVAHGCDWAMESLPG